MNIRGTARALTRSTRDPQDLLGDILRHEGLQPFIHLLGRVGVAAEPRHRELGLDHARADVAHADVVADEFAEEGTGKGRDGVFWGVQGGDQLPLASSRFLSSLVPTTDGSILTRGSVDRASGIRFCKSEIQRRISVSGPQSSYVGRTAALARSLPCEYSVLTFSSDRAEVDDAKTRRTESAVPPDLIHDSKYWTYWPALRFLNSVWRGFCQFISKGVAKLTDDSPRTKSWVKVISPRTLVWNMMSISSSSISPTCSFPYTKPACIASQGQESVRFFVSR